MSIRKIGTFVVVLTITIGFFTGAGFFDLGASVSSSSENKGIFEKLGDMGQRLKSWLLGSKKADLDADKARELLKEADQVIQNKEEQLSQATDPREVVRIKRELEELKGKHKNLKIALAFISGAAVGSIGYLAKEVKERIERGNLEEDFEKFAALKVTLQNDTEEMRLALAKEKERLVQERAKAVSAATPDDVAHTMGQIAGQAGAFVKLEAEKATTKLAEAKQSYEFFKRHAEKTAAQLAKADQARDQRYDKDNFELDYMKRKRRATLAVIEQEVAQAKLVQAQLLAAQAAAKQAETEAIAGSLAERTAAIKPADTELTADQITAKVVKEKQEAELKKATERIEELIAKQKEVDEVETAAIDALERVVNDKERAQSEARWKAERLEREAAQAERDALTKAAEAVLRAERKADAAYHYQMFFINQAYRDLVATINRSAKQESDRLVEVEAARAKQIAEEKEAVEALHRTKREAREAYAAVEKQYGRGEEEEGDDDEELKPDQLFELEQPQPQPPAPSPEQLPGLELDQPQEVDQLPGSRQSSETGQLPKPDKQEDTVQLPNSETDQLLEPNLDQPSGSGQSPEPKIDKPADTGQSDDQ